MTDDEKIKAALALLKGPDVKAAEAEAARHMQAVDAFLRNLGERAPLPDGWVYAMTAAGTVSVFHTE